jgi:hypothetical protein
MFSAGRHEVDGASKDSTGEFVWRPGRRPSGNHDLVIGRVVAVHIDDDVLTKDGQIDILKIRPIARLGYKDYTSVDSIFQMEKRTPEDR